jgi:hypothetical protein
MKRLSRSLGDLGLWLWHWLTLLVPRTARQLLQVGFFLCVTASGAIALLAFAHGQLLVAESYFGLTNGIVWLFAIVYRFFVKNVPGEEVPDSGQFNPMGRTYLAVMMIYCGALLLFATLWSLPGADATLTCAPLVVLAVEVIFFHLLRQWFESGWKKDSRACKNVFSRWLLARMSVAEDRGLKY